MSFFLIGLGATGLFTFGYFGIEFGRELKASEHYDPPTINDAILLAIIGLAFINSGALMYAAARVGLWAGLLLSLAACTAGLPPPKYPMPDASQLLARHEAITAGFYNIDVDTSTLVDLSQATLDAPAGLAAAAWRLRYEKLTALAKRYHESTVDQLESEVRQVEQATKHAQDVMLVSTIAIIVVGGLLAWLTARAFSPRLSHELPASLDQAGFGAPRRMYHI